MRGDRRRRLGAHRAVPKVRRARRRRRLAPRGNDCTSAGHRPGARRSDGTPGSHRQGLLGRSIDNQDRVCASGGPGRAGKKARGAVSTTTLTVQRRCRPPPRRTLFSQGKFARIRRASLSRDAVGRRRRTRASLALQPVGTRPQRLNATDSNEEERKQEQANDIDVEVEIQAPAIDWEREYEQQEREESGCGPIVEKAATNRLDASQ